MSVRTMSRVWADSKHSGSDLLMLLAIADFADDDGNAYPSVSTLANKCRMKVRNANYVLAALQKSGELEVRANEGPKGTNRYRITLMRLPEGVQRIAGSGAAMACTPAEPCTLQRSASTPAKACAKPLQRIADEPSLNHQEPSGKPLARPKAPRTPNCPHEEIVLLFHQQLPDLPRVVLLDTRDRRRKIAEFWAWVLSSTKSDGTRRAETAEQALKWISTYFARARENDFVMGRAGRGAGHENWRCTLDYLITDKGKTQVIERTEAVAA